MDPGARWPGFISEAPLPLTTCVTLRADLITVLCLKFPCFSKIGMMAKYPPHMVVVRINSVFIVDCIVQTFFFIFNIFYWVYLQHYVNFGCTAEVT